MKSIEDFEGLWKFIVPMPRIGLMKAIMEIEVSNGVAEGYACLNDIYEGELENLQFNAEKCMLKTRVILMGKIFEFKLRFLDSENKIRGKMVINGNEIDIVGSKMDFGAPQDSLNKESFDILEKELKNRVREKISPLSEDEMRSNVEDLLSKMTLDEKIGQMYQLPHATNITGPDADLENVEQLIKKGKAGSFLGVHTSLQCYALQKIAVEQSRLGIPLMFMADVIHGFRTIFPIPLALSCSWDMDAIARAERVAAIESSVAGICLSFAPMVDITRDPRWGRIMEGAGEDPFLGYHCAQAHVKGFQDNDLFRKDTIIGCVKHYAAYGGAEAGRDYNTVDMSEYRLRNFYLPPYKGAVDAAVGCLMSSFNTILGQPATGNKYLLHDVLRDEWGFEGMIISDYNSVIEMIAHSTAKDLKNAAKLAIESSLDIEMVSSAYLTCLKSMVEEGEIKEELINKAVRRILYYKYKVGLFSDPYYYMDPQGCKDLHLCDKHRKISREIATKTFVLLENKIPQGKKTPLLPIRQDDMQSIKKIALIGPFSDQHKIIGAWSAMGNTKESVTLKMGLENKFSKWKSPPEILVEKGCSIRVEIESDFEKSKAVAQDSDIIILALGEDERMSGEAKSRGYLNIPGSQEALAKKLKELGKPMVLILFTGRPLTIPWFKENMDAILLVWMPGSEGGNAIADVLVGDVCPSGKLSTTFPYALGQVPIYYNHYTTGRPPLINENNQSFRSTYIDMPNDPLYPFGYGLSYTKFKYSNLQLDKQKMKKGDVITVTVEINNIGNCRGEEIVQMYIQDVVGTFVRPVKELKGFEKISIDPQTSKTVSFTINESLLSYWKPSELQNKKYEFIAESGEFIVFIGGDSSTTIQKSFILE